MSVEANKNTYGWSGEITNVNVTASRLCQFFVLATIVSAANFCGAENSNAAGGYEDLLSLFAEWCEFEQPPLRDGAPDYTAERFEAANRELSDYQSRLGSINTRGWPIEQQVDWHLLRADTCVSSHYISHD